MYGGNVGFLALVVAFTLPPLIRLACGEPPSPEGEGFGAVELGGCSGKLTWAAARRLASPFGRGAQCAHWAERVFPDIEYAREGSLSRLRRQLSQRESQVGCGRTR